MDARRYTRLEKLGEGTYGVVYRAKCKDTGGIVALKHVRLDVTVGDGVPCTTVREISLLKELKHPNIVKLIDVCGTTGDHPRLALVFEFVEQDLKKYIESNAGVLRPWAIQRLFRHLLLGLQCCHSRCVLHRDLKPQNLLVDPGTTTLKVADFGLGRTFGIPVKRYTHEVVTLWYRPPDVLLGAVGYGTSVDLWSCGCIFAEMVDGVPLLQGKSDMDQLLRMHKFFGTPRRDVFPSVLCYPNSALVLSQEVFLQVYAPVCDSHFRREKFLSRVSEEGVSVLRSLLEWEPTRRMSSTIALQQPYFQLEFVDRV